MGNAKMTLVTNLSKPFFLVFALFFSLFNQWRSKHNQGQGQQDKKQVVAQPSVLSMKTIAKRPEREQQRRRKAKVRRSFVHLILREPDLMPESVEHLPAFHRPWGMVCHSNPSVVVQIHRQLDHHLPSSLPVLQLLHYRLGK